MNVIYFLFILFIYNGWRVLYKGLLYLLEMFNWLFLKVGEFLFMYKKLVLFDELFVVVFGNLYMMNLYEIGRILKISWIL